MALAHCQKKLLFNRDFSKSHLTFQRRWAKAQSACLNQPSPTVEHLPLPLIPDTVENDSTIPSLLRRVFGRPSSLQSRTVSRIQESPQEFSEESEDILNFDAASKIRATQ